MKTTIDVMTKVLDCEIGDQDDVRANVFHKTNLGDIQKCIIEYAKLVIDEILTRPDMIYVDWSGYDDMPDEAVYDYEAFEKFKKKKIA